MTKKIPPRRELLGECLGGLLAWQWLAKDLIGLVLLAVNPDRTRIGKKETHKLCRDFLYDQVAQVGRVTDVRSGL